jgi:hypothetical protein
MTAQYFFPDVTFKEMAELSDWTPGYVVWPFKFWKWIMDKDIKIIDYDLIDLNLWAKEGLSGFKKSISEKEFKWMCENSKNIESLHQDIKEVVNHKNFTYPNHLAKFSDLQQSFNKGSVCEVVLDACTLDKEEGYSPHRVVITDITKDSIVFHDPRIPPMPNRKELTEHFVKAWLEVEEDPELCVYSK